MNVDIFVQNVKQFCKAQGTNPTAACEASGAGRNLIVRDVQVAGTLMHPILVNVDMDSLTVTGNTFPVRKLMRELGLDWDREAKAWTGSREALNALCVKYA